MRNAQQRGAVCARRELRNCHFSGNLCPTRGESLACKRISTKWRTSATREVPQAAHYIGAAKRCPAGAVGVTPSVSHTLDSSLIEGAMGIVGVFALPVQG